MPDIVDKLLKAMHKGGAFGPRMRFAVSPTEYEELKTWCLRNGVFYRRLLNVPLVVEDDPEHPPLLKEISPVADKTHWPTL